jgi:hypothetical protein
MGWKDRLTFRERHFVEHDVCGTRLRFYPNRIGLLHELAEVSKPVAAALAALFADKSGDATSTDKTMVQGDTTVRECSLQGVAPEVIRLRADERERAVAALLSAVSDARNRLLLGRLLMDSLRDEFPYAVDRPPAEVEEFLYGSADFPGLDVPAVASMVGGWIKANAQVFGDAGKQVAALVESRLGGLVPPRPNDSPSESPSPSDGSSSKTPSSQPSPAASP